MEEDRLLILDDYGVRRFEIIFIPGRIVLFDFCLGKRINFAFSKREVKEAAKFIGNLLQGDV
jgi:hypothetical protein